MNKRAKCILSHFTLLKIKKNKKHIDYSILPGIDLKGMEESNVIGKDYLSGCKSIEEGSIAKLVILVL